MDPSVDSMEAPWCVVTGGRGFMARHLVVALLRSGGWRVRISDLGPEAALESAEKDGLLGAALRNGRAVYVSADVCEIAQLTKALEGVDTVFHTAAADHTKDNFQLHYKVNVEGTENVIEACNICKVKTLIYTSTSAVVFDGVHGLFGVDESTPYPDKFPDAYAHTKAEAEKLVMRANDINKLLTCCIRPGSIFGPGDTILPILVSYGGMMPIIGDGHNWDDFIYVENVAHGHMCAQRTLSTKEGAKRSGGKAYFITNMEPMNMWDFLFMALEDLGYKSRFRLRVPSNLLMLITCMVNWIYDKIICCFGMQKPCMLTSTLIKYATLDRTFNCNNAVEQLGYKPIVSLKDGIKLRAKFFKQSRA